jgi:hypothetical protein
MTERKTPAQLAAHMAAAEIFATRGFTSVEWDLLEKAFYRGCEYGRMNPITSAPSRTYVRPVLFQRYGKIPLKDGETYQRHGYFPEEPGVFHAWGSDADGGGGTISAAIIEATDRTVHLCAVDKMKFRD